MKTSIQNLFLLSAILLFMLPESAYALPGFTRQTGKDCMTCHAQNMPKLNAYGRHFALSGYTIYNPDSETQSLIEGSEVALGLPAVLNVSAVLKARYIKSSRRDGLTANDDIVGVERGELQVLDASGLFFGGRIAENVGGIISLTDDSSDENDVAFGGKAVLSYPMLSGFGGLSLYSTQVNGAFSGMENFNTGLNSPLRQFENANGTNAAQATGVGRGPSTGLQMYYGDERFFATVGGVIPSQNNEGIDAGGSVIPFWRVSYNQPIGEWNVMLGTYGMNGKVKASDQSIDGGLIDNGALLVEVDKEVYGFDFEASGPIGNMMTMTTINVVTKNTVDPTPANLLTSTNLKKTDNEASSIEFQINPVKSLGVKLAYLDYTNNDPLVAQDYIESYDFDAYSVGLNYLARQNIVFDIEYTHNTVKSIDKDDFYDLYLSATIAF